MSEIEMMAHLRRMLAYDEWASDEAHRSLAAIDTPPSKSVRLIAHIAAVEWLWLSRLRGVASPLAVWPELTLAETAQQLAELPAAWREYLDARPAVAGLSERIAYTNSKGEPWTNTVGDILTHIVAHSGYHRGQIASDVRAAGHEPAYTDFIHWVRSREERGSRE